MGEILIRGGSVVDGSGPPAFDADVRVSGRTIVEIGTDLTPNDGERVIDARGAIVAPGFIDIHTHLDPTLANKLFDFMAVGLPVVGSDGRAIRRLLERTGAGRTFRSGDADDFGRVIDETLDAPRMAKDMSNNALRFADAEFDRKYDARRLLDALEAAGDSN